MPFDITNCASDPSAIKLPGSSTISFQLSGTASTRVSIEYRLSPTNKVFFSNGQKTLPGGTVTLNGSAMNRSRLLNFIDNGNDKISFVVRVFATDVSNGATKPTSTQIAIL